MITYYLKFSSEEEWEQSAATAGIRVNKPVLIEEQTFDPDTGDVVPAVYEDNWSWLYYTHEWAVDNIGTIYNNDGVYSDEGEVVTPPTPMDGWHVNFKGTLPDGWDAYVVTPNTPYRIFAGD